MRGYRVVAAGVLGVVSMVAGLPAAGSAGNAPPPDAGQERDPVQAGPLGPPAMAAADGTALVARGGPEATATLYDDADRPLWEGPLPFAEDVAYPDVTALDDGSFVVAGTPCGTTQPGDSTGAACAPGGVALARFDPDSKTFTPVPVTGLEGTTSAVETLGQHGSDLVLRVGGQLHVVPADGGALAPLPAAPFESTTVACLQGDQVVVVERKDGPGDLSPEPGEMVEVAAGPYVPFEAAVLDLATQQWTNLGGPDATYESNDTFEIGCLDQGVLAAPTERPFTAGAPYVSFVLDMTAGEWQQAEPPPREFLAAAPATADGDELAMSVSSDVQDQDTAVLFFDTNSRTWRSEQGGEGSDAAAVALADGHVWDLPAEGPAQEPADLPVAPQASAPMAAAAANVDIKVFEWNMCGAKCFLNSTSPTDSVHYIVAGSNPKPWTISLNEVCLNSNQHFRLVNILDDLGYHGNLYVAKAVVANCGNTSFGNSVFSIGGPLAVSRYTFSTQDTVDSDEKKGVVCSKDSGFLGDWLACSTHMDNTTAYSSKQSNELLWTAAGAGNMLAIYGGDFNLLPSHASIVGWRDGYDEIDESQPWANTTDSHGKLDYIWIRDTGSMTSPFPPVITSDGPGRSDHYYYSGTFRLLL